MASIFEPNFLTCCSLSPLTTTQSEAFSFNVLAPQDGHVVGIVTLDELDSLFDMTTLIIWGITSPALLMITVSPTLGSNRLTSSMLCKVQLLTITPPTFTGLSLATGVNIPVLPTWKSIDSIEVVASSAGNLCAIAHLGDLDTSPSLDW